MCAISLLDDTGMCSVLGPSSGTCSKTSAVLVFGSLTRDSSPTANHHTHNSRCSNQIDSFVSYFTVPTSGHKKSDFFICYLPTMLLPIMFLYAMFPYGNMFLLPQEHMCSKGNISILPYYPNATPSPQRPSYPTQLCTPTLLCPQKGGARFRSPTLIVSWDTGSLPLCCYSPLNDKLQTVGGATSCHYPTHESVIIEILRLSGFR